MEIDLLKNYPKAKRDLKKRGTEKTELDRKIARGFGKEFFDGDRKNGYGGFSYNSRFWQPVVPDFVDHFNLNAGSSILDVGCAKGFMMYDFSKLIPGVTVRGVDISEYAVKNAKNEMKPFIQVENAKSLSFNDNSFDLVISINTIHNLNKKECAQALIEIERVSKGKSFITVDAYRNNEEKKAMMAWNLTAKTIMHVDDWKLFFKDCGYSGDYFWFIP